MKVPYLYIDRFGEGIMWHSIYKILGHDEYVKKIIRYYPTLRVK